MPPATTGAFSNHLAPGFWSLIGAELRGADVFYSRYYDIETSRRNFEDVLAVAGLPVAPRKFEAQNIVAIDPLEGNTKRITHEEWGIGAEISETVWEDDLYAGEGSVGNSVYGYFSL